MNRVLGVRRCFACAVVALCIGLAGHAAVAGSDKDAKDAQANKPAPQKPAFVYKPPLRGAPGARVGGGTRGSGEQAAKLEVLAPDHVGLTTRAQPVLYWYAHAPAPVHFQFALMDDSIDPLLEIQTVNQQVSGIQSLDLADHGVSLQPGVTYYWSVALVTDAGNRSADIVSSGMIERIEPGEGLTSRINGNRGIDLAEMFASEGIWYDALATLSGMIAAAPGDERLVSIRDALLEQEGLRAEVD